MHLFEDRISAVPGAKLRPANVSLEDYRQLQRRMGLTRMVIVQPSTYGFENQVMMDGLVSSEGARGVAVIQPTVSDAELKAMHTAGVRGIRLNLSFGGARIEDMERLSARVNELGWQVQFVSPGSFLPELEARFRRLPSPLVIDHTGEISQPGGITSEPFKVLERLLNTDHVWVKLSGAYISSAIGAPGFADVGKIAMALVAQRADRLVGVLTGRMSLRAVRNRTMRHWQTCYWHGHHPKQCVTKFCVTMRVGFTILLKRRVRPLRAPCVWGFEVAF